MRQDRFTFSIHHFSYWCQLPGFAAGFEPLLPRAVKEDESAYLLLGHNLVTGNGFTYTGYPELHFPPLHPF